MENVEQTREPLPAEIIELLSAATGIDKETLQNNWDNFDGKEAEAKRKEKFAGLTHQKIMARGIAESTAFAVAEVQAIEAAKLCLRAGSYRGAYGLLCEQMDQLKGLYADMLNAVYELHRRLEDLEPKKEEATS